MYLGNVFDGEAGVERASRSNSRGSVEIWREMASLLTNKSITMAMESGGVYERFVSCQLCCMELNHGLKQRI